MAQKALDALAQPFIFAGHDLHISGSIGISVYPDDGSDVETLMRTADTAMYHAKESGRGNFQFFTAALNEAAQQRFDVGTRLRCRRMRCRNYSDEPSPSASSLAALNSSSSELGFF